MTDKIMEQIQGIRERHEESVGIGGQPAGECRLCGMVDGWPCDAYRMAEKLELAVKALETLTRGEGPYDRDEFMHACKVIDAMKAEAVEALAAIADRGNE